MLMTNATQVPMFSYPIKFVLNYSHKTEPQALPGRDAKSKNRQGFSMDAENHFSPDLMWFCLFLSLKSCFKHKTFHSITANKLKLYFEQNYHVNSKDVLIRPSLSYICRSFINYAEGRSKSARACHLLAPRTRRRYRQVPAFSSRATTFRPGKSIRTSL